MSAIARTQAKRWTATINNYSTNDIDAFLNLEDKVKWAIAGRESAPTTGTPHLQCFFHFKTVTRGSAILKLFPTAHLEVAKKSDQENLLYCSKEGDYEIIGSFELETGVSRAAVAAASKDRSSGKAPAKKTKQTQKEIYEETKKLAIAGNLTDIRADHYIKHYSNLKRIVQDNPKKPDDIDGDLRGLWLWGPPGTGKSMFARYITGWKAYDKNANKWWCGYKDQEDVIIDDLDKSHAVLAHHLKLWADRYKITAEIKGSAICIRPKRIIITSNYDIDAIGWDEETVKALKRRFKIIHFDEKIDLQNMGLMAEEFEIDVVQPDDVAKAQDLLDPVELEMDDLLAAQNLSALDSTPPSSEETPMWGTQPSDIEDADLLFNYYNNKTTKKSTVKISGITSDNDENVDSNATPIDI